MRMVNDKYIHTYRRGHTGTQINKIATVRWNMKDMKSIVYNCHITEHNNEPTGEKGVVERWENKQDQSCLSKEQFGNANGKGKVAMTRGKAKTGLVREN